MRLLLVALAALTIAPAGRAQVSPGPLSRAHRDLEGNANCLKCHAASREELDPRCLDCHAEIVALRAAKRGLHARITDTCAKCHPEHAGADFKLIDWPGGAPERFDHGATGWLLKGKHAELKCRECHKPAFQVSDVLRLSKRSDREAGYLGLVPDCAACHRDVHRAALGARCDACHVPTAWKPASAFDHRNASFPITGRHAELPCAKCHRLPGIVAAAEGARPPLPVFKPLPHAECSVCHSDPHAARLGPACSRCHVTDSFHRVEKKSFDHDLTRFPLAGRHASVDCARCHDPATAWGKKPSFSTCRGCHRDPHAGKATLAGRSVDCDACHRVEGFRAAVVTAEQHRQSGFPLEGRHLQLRCEDCHRKGTVVELRPAHARCGDCHADPHGGQLSSRVDGGECGSCHRVDGWKPSTLTARQHASFALALEGRHAAVECAACHAPARSRAASRLPVEKLGKAGIALRLGAPSCASCHFDPHDGRFAAGGARAKKDDCAACHGFDAFRPSIVDADVHRGFSYPVEGAHRRVPCERCHKELQSRPVSPAPPPGPGKAAILLFALDGGNCQGCHKSPHGEMFALRRDHGACAGCHGDNSFRPASRFDHDRDTHFPLLRAHRNLPCLRCHVQALDASGVMTPVYRPLSMECKACHLRTASSASADRGTSSVPARGRPVSPQR